VRLTLLLFSLFLLGCVGERPLTPEMKKNARKTVELYLTKYQLPLDGLETFKSKAKPKPDFSFLYTGSNRCIEFIVYCYGGTKCTELRSYPYIEHGEECPVETFK